MFPPPVPQKFYRSVFATQQLHKIPCPAFVLQTTSLQQRKRENERGSLAAVGSLVYTFYTRRNYISKDCE